VKINQTIPVFVRFLGRSFLLVVLLSSFISTASSQNQSTSLTVRVTDATGSVKAGASVIISKVGGPEVRRGTTSDRGTVVFENIEPGEYEVLVQAPGFNQLKQTVMVARNSQRELPVQLASAEVAQLVVTPEEQQESVSSLPNQNNDLGPVLQVATGAVPLGPTALGQVIVDGKGLDQQTARLDGIDFTVLTSLPSADASIDPVSSLTNPAVAGNLDKNQLRSGAFESRYGPGTGAVADNLTYTGFGRDKTRWTAEFYGENRNDFFNARNFFDYEGKNGLRRTRVGGRASRSLDQLGQKFIFVSYETLRGRVERPVYEAVPVDSTCCPTQLSLNLLRAYRPSGTQIITNASQNPDFLVARRRTRTSVNANAFDMRFEYSPFIKAKDPDGNIAVKAADFFTLRFTRQGTENLVPDGVTGRRQRQNILFNNLAASFQFLTSVITTHIVRFGVNAARAKVGVEIPPESDALLATAAINTTGNVSAVGLPGELQTVPVATLGSLAKGIGRGFRFAPTSYGLSYDVDRTGKENDIVRSVLNAGVEVRFIRLALDRLGGLTYSFPSVSALRNGIPSSVSFQSDLSGPSPFSPGTGERQARQVYVMGYVQRFHAIGEPSQDHTNEDKNLPRLRITYGLRYDYFSPVRERDGRAVVVDPVDPLSGTSLKTRTTFYRTGKFNLQPRASFVYRLADDGFLGNTVISGGAGVYYGTPRIGDLLLPIDSDRFSIGLNELPFPVSPSILMNNFLENPRTRQFQPLAFSRDFAGVERAYKWDAKLSQTISGYDIGISYSGNRGRNLPLANIANKIVEVSTNPDPTKKAIIRREFDLVEDGQIFKPLGEFFFRTSKGRSAYDALTVAFNRNRSARPKPSSGWLATAVAKLNVQYTLSRSVSNASGAVLSNPFNANADLGNNIGIPRHLFKLSGVYELWAAKGESPAKSWLSWKIMPQLKLTSGLPLIVRLDRPDVVYVDSTGNFFSDPAIGRTAVINTPGGGASGGARVPDLVPGANPYLRDDRQFLNPAAFAIPAPGQFGNFRRGQLHGPSFMQFDLSVRRNLFETEKSMSAQFQVDIFNVFNRANFINPTVSLPGTVGTSTVDNQLQPGVPFTRAAAGTFGRLTTADVGRFIQFSVTFRLNDGFSSYRLK
jgi:Carboxypeptidase regulatory-like domain